MESFKFNVEGSIVELGIDIINISTLLRTTLDTDLDLDRGEDGFPIVYIATVDDITRLQSYYLYGRVTPGIIEAFDRLLVEPAFNDMLRLKLHWLDKICKNKDNEIRAIHVPHTRRYSKELQPPTLKDIWKPVRKFQDYGILLSDLNCIPKTYALIPISQDGPRGSCTVRYPSTQRLPRDGDMYSILDDVCDSAYQTLKKYRGTYSYLLVVSDHPLLYSIEAYIRMYKCRK